MGNNRILMVDDDPMILKFVSVNLKVRGFQVTTAEDGEAALKAAKETSPDLVILDLLMPGIDGSEVCRRIREWSTVPILVLTAIGESTTKWRLIDLGANDYMTKPFDIADLLKRVKLLLQAESSEPLAG